MSIKAFIFDLDGVIVSTDEYHFRAWKQVADEETIYFDELINERLRGVSRMESLDIVLERAQKEYSQDEKAALAERKNEYYKEYIKGLTCSDILPGVLNLLEELKKRGVKTAIGTSSKNSSLILEKIELNHHFDAVADGNGIKNSKPDPEVFLLAAKKLGLKPEECLVIEDADAGVEAAIAGNMKVLGVGSAYDNPKADYTCNDFRYISLNSILIEE